MKKNIFLAILIVLVIAISGFIIIWFNLFSGSNHTTFLPMQGEFMSGPEFTVTGDTYTIGWSTKNDYNNNEIILKKSTAKYPDFGVGADSQFDSGSASYRHTAKFRLAKNALNKTIPVFETGIYTFQVISSTETTTEAVISRVESLE